MDIAEEIKDLKSLHRFTIIGLLASTAANLEYTIELILLGLLDTDQRYGGAVIRWVSRNQQIALIKSIIKDRYGENSDLYKEINKALYGDNGVGGIDRALKDRHKLIHAVYEEINTGSYQKLYKRSSFEVESDPVNEKDMMDKAKNLVSEYENLLKIAINHNLPFPKVSFHEKQKLLAEAANQRKDHKNEEH